MVGTRRTLTAIIHRVDIVHEDFVDGEVAHFVRGAGAGVD